MTTIVPDQTVREHLEAHDFEERQAVAVTDALRAMTAHLATRDDLAAIDARFDAVDAKFAAIDARFDAVGAQFRGLWFAIAGLGVAVAILAAAVFSTVLADDPTPVVVLEQPAAAEVAPGR